MRSHVVRGGLLVLALLGAGCGRAFKSGPREPDPRTTLRVENQNFLDMNIYVIQGAQRIRLGTVPGLSNETFTIPAYIVRSSPLQFEIHPIGGLGNPRTETISVQAGDEVRLVIPPR